ncbi:class I SAM-dependent methyltransferase [Bradymonadaceae bacterium TMQ3]|uniref:Class I SAM-dependent methyltransferase n=1 Tax=Lujinxingia sediminis TaxID=2480984 RepID=A0ABY0CSJ7_9DELT|nr:class I SAM-dependent methyltransferase [Lujinxingia sediminis]RDV38322.1 class I SAM-dependent methyltransferase [Bradymonadaceae bacterium TMQ3]RVU43475.1 class I SAM-dependent methyltransferase [Lujinxingia sediminis]TXC75996.1 class I SAM-dependent methyltransferase [Bradymonadales bacterium TMQ1]
MPANFTRRLDLFKDAGFAEPRAAVELLTSDAEALGIGGVEPGTPLEDALRGADQQAAELLDEPVGRLLDNVVEWLFERGGDLATLFWLARKLSSDESSLHLGALAFGVASRLWQAGKEAEAAAMVRFLVDLDFDYGKLYRESGIAYGFFQSREPNPFVWKLLDFVDERARNRGEQGAIKVAELGCGIGNDALGIISSPRVNSYLGIDISPVALEEHRKRVAPVLEERTELEHNLLAGDFVSTLERNDPRVEGVNLIYSYSSLHYFSSGELSRIFSLAAELLPAQSGLFCFAIKGKDSIWDGQGVPLYRPDVWVNLDGQTRWFPSRQALAKMLDEHGFEILMHEWHEHWGYSEFARRDRFHYVVATPRRKQGASA